MSSLTNEQWVCIGLSVLLIFVLLRSNMCRVYRFYKPTCPACVSSKEEWDKFASNKMFSMVRTISVDLTNPSNKKLAEEFNVQVVPTVIMVKPSGANFKYNGERTASAYSSWVDSV